MRIVGAVDSHLRPPADPPSFLAPAAEELARLATAAPERAAYRQILEEERKRQARLKSLGETALWAYQAIELSRIEGDPLDGLVVLIPGHGMNPYSVWTEADHFLFDHFDRSEEDLDMR